MKKRYRFEIDLTKGQPLPEKPAEDSFTPSAPPADALELSPAPPMEVEVELEAPPPPQKPSPETVRVYRDLRSQLERLGQKHVLRREGNDRLEELLLKPCGSLSRIVYERVCGPEQDLGALRDLAGLPDSHFAAWPGYEMRSHLYQAEAGVLQWSRLEMTAWVNGGLSRKFF